MTGKGEVVLRSSSGGSGGGGDIADRVEIKTTAYVYPVCTRGGIFFSSIWGKSSQVLVDDRQRMLSDMAFWIEYADSRQIGDGAVTAQEHNPRSHDASEDLRGLADSGTEARFAACLFARP